MEASPANTPLLMHCPECGKTLDVAGLPPYAKIECPHCAALIRVRSTMGQYQIVGLLGEGGMSQVFRALDRNLGREVALKILHQSLSSDDALTSMFEREAQLTASIVHPNVVKVFTVGQDHGYFFIAMELLQAVSLEQLIANKGALSESEVLGTALDVARGLKAAFEEKLIHRDIKPGNMLVTGDGTTKLVDFGLALQQGGEDLSEDLWATPFYVPPEKLDGAPDTFLGDIYSLGATLYHALAGKPPFDANTSSLEELKAIKKLPVDLKSAAPGLSKPTVKLVERMMAYRPEDRVQSYDELIALIEEVRRRQFGIETTGRTRTQRKRLGVLLGGGAGLLALAVAAALILADRGEPLDEGELGITKGERVITIDDSTVTGQFQSARDLLGEGRFREAADLFGALVANETAPASTRIWSHFLLGTIRLVNGEQELARESFHALGQLSPETEAASVEALAFLQRAATVLAEPLPLLPDQTAFSGESIEALGLLAAGLKNWQAGEFESGIGLLRAFAASHPPETYPWLARLKGRVEPFLADFALLESLPNPTASELESGLAAQSETLRRGAAALRTRGAAPRLVKRRLDRIDEIRKFASAPDPEDEPDGAPPVAPVAPVTSVAPLPEAPSPADQAEIERLRALVASNQSVAETLLFSGAAVRLQGESFQTLLGASLREELVRGYEEAEKYLGELAGALAGKPWEGIVRRRNGRPLEATVASSDADTFIVDLGFGPNEVGVGEFAPDWLVEAGVATLPPLAPDTIASWERLVFFGLFTGQGNLIAAKADELAAADPGFARRWSLVQRLR